MAGSRGREREGCQPLKRGWGGGQLTFSLATYRRLPPVPAITTRLHIGHNVSGLPNWPRQQCFRWPEYVRPQPDRQTLPLTAAASWDGAPRSAARSRKPAVKRGRNRDAHRAGLRRQRARPLEEEAAVGPSNPASLRLVARTSRSEGHRERRGLRRSVRSPTHRRPSPLATGLLSLGPSRRSREPPTAELRQCPDERSRCWRRDRRPSPPIRA